MSLQISFKTTCYFRANIRLKIELTPIEFVAIEKNIPII